MRVVFACAGTGGHINPAISMANIILKNEPDSNILFIGSKNGLENELVPKSGFEIKNVRTGKILRKLTFKNIKALFDAYKGISDAKDILRSFKPDVVIGTGGYICMPVMVAAKKLNIPYILHESNAFPGLSTKLLAKNAAKVLIGFEDAKNRINKNSNVVCTGTPTKFSCNTIENLNRKECLKNLGLFGINKKIVLVTCGSQGARKINETVLQLVQTKLDNKLYFILVTGKNNYDTVLKQVKEIEKSLNKSLDEYLKLEKFVFNMEEMYKVADVCVTRAGAMTVTELDIVKKPAILIPLPSAAENHQYYNAKVLEKNGMAKVIEEANLTVESLYDSINDFANKEVLAKNLSSIFIEDVENRIYSNIKDVVK